MTTTEQEDPDGLHYATVRKVVGPTTSIVTTIDLHTNISQRMVDNASVIVSYRTDPHLDQYECGKEAAALLLEMLGGLSSVVWNIRVPIVPPNVSLLTDNGPYGDTSYNGLHIVVTARENVAEAQVLCIDLAEMAWAMRERFLWDLVPIDEAVARAVTTGIDSSTPPILLADLGDNIGAGGPGNTQFVVEGAVVRYLHPGKFHITFGLLDGMHR